MTKPKSASILVILALLFILFTTKGLVLDPDLGWHLITGQYMLHHRIPKTDPFSYSMPSYPILDHEWLSDKILFVTYQLFGIAGLAVIYAAIALTSVLLQIPKSTKFLMIPLLLSGATILFITGIKQQVLSWLLFSFLILVLRNKKLWQKIRLVIPFYFLLWANLHGSFPLGLATLLLMVIIDGIDTKKFNKTNISIILLSSIATLCNPYGFNLWHEVFITLNQPEIHFMLAEWYPSFFVPYFPMWILIFTSGILLWQFQKKFTLWEKGMWVLLLSISIQSIRNIPFWVIFSLPVTCQSIDLLYEEVKRNNERMFIKAGKIFSLSAILLSVTQGYFTFFQPAYPEKAMIYLKNHPFTGNLFSDFNWGGYQLWQLPQKKIFIDGQMSNWRQNNKINESSNAFQEFYWVANRAENITELSKKYNITTLLLTNPPFAFWKQGDFNLFDVRKHQIYPAITTQLKTGGWHIVYQDNISIIYQK